MAVTQQSRTAPPLKITGLLQAQWANQVLRTAVELDLFSNLAAGPATAREVALRLGLNEQALTRLLLALVCMEYLAQAGEKFSLTDIARDYLVKSSPLYFGDYVLFKDKLDESWRQLTTTVKTGEPFTRVNQDAVAEEFFPRLATAIFPINFTTAQMVADELGIASMNSPRILDLAAGTAVWSIPAAQANKNARIDALDFAPVIEVAKRFVAKHGVSEQYAYLTGNWRDIKLSANEYDVIYLGHILHSEGKQVAQELLNCCVAALKPGGRIVVAEFLGNDAHNAPLFTTLFAVNMMLATTSGCTFAISELNEMFMQAGLKGAEQLRVPFWEDQSPIVVGQK